MWVGLNPSKKSIKNQKTFFLKGCHILPTLYNNLVAGHQYLLSVRCLGILKNGGALLGSTRVGHGDGLQTLDAFGPWGCQLDRTIRGYSNWKNDTEGSILSVKFSINIISSNK